MIYATSYWGSRLFPPSSAASLTRSRPGEVAWVPVALALSSNRVIILFPSA
jgi:hypothetical protein